MCSTCDYRKYEKVSVQTRNKVEEKLEHSIGMGNLVIQCDLKGKDYSILDKTNLNSGFRIYRCPTCGHTLF